MLAMFSLSTFLCILWLFSRAAVCCLPVKPQQGVLVTYQCHAEFISQRPRLVTVFCWEGKGILASMLFLDRVNVFV